MKYAFGIMSGTSLDALDVGLFAFEEHFKKWHVQAFQSRSFTPAFKTKILNNTQVQSSSVQDIAELNVELSRLSGDVVLNILKQEGLQPSQVHCIGYHGQTVWHDPVFGTTLQLGDGPTLARITQIPVVNNFRTLDMAYGGQGAPLMPFAHKILFNIDAKENIAVHNLGGISNPSYWGVSQQLAFDTGPCNILLDTLSAELLHKPYDAEGQTARRGTVCDPLWQHFLNHPYFKKQPPKSTGRELFGSEYASQWLERIHHYGLTSEEALATAVTFVVETIKQAYQDFILPHGLDKIIFCGGGVKNLFLLEKLRLALPTTQILTSQDLGFDPQVVECAGFAIMGTLGFERKINHIARLTHASHDLSLGQICYP